MGAFGGVPLRLALALVALSLLALVPAGTASEQVEFVCPKVADALPGQAVSCPTYVLDVEDLFGQPILVADPNNVHALAFSAIHGGRGLHPLPNDAPPTERSRQNSVHQPHTTFVSTNGGQGWTDAPYYAPDAIDPATAGNVRTASLYGEDNAAAVDGKGRLVLGALYSYADESRGGFLGTVQQPPTYRFAVALWRAGKVGTVPDYNTNLNLITLPAGVKADSLRLTAIPAADVVLATWRQEDGANASLVAGAWAKATDAGVWTPLDANKTVQGCRDVGAPFAEGAAVYFACAGPQGARLAGLEAANWTALDAGALPVPGAGHVDAIPLTGTGLYAAVESGVSDGAPRVLVAFGHNGSWSAPDDYAKDLTRGGAVRSARVTALAYQPVSGNLHLIYEERAADATQASGKPSIGKTFAAIKARGGLEARMDLNLGQLQRPDVPPTYAGVGDGGYEDLHDTLLVWLDPAGGAPRELVAFGDYGFVRYAEILEHDAAPPLVPLSVNVPPVPAASPGTVPALVGVPAGLLAGAAATRVALARRKKTVEARNDE